MENALVALSNDLATAVERAGRPVVVVNARSCTWLVFAAYIGSKASSSRRNTP